MTRVELRARHGTPEEFERATWRAHADLFISTEEAEAAIAKYNAEWAAAAPPAGTVTTTRRDDPAALYEALRKIIDGGSESMTHEDALAAVRAAMARDDTPAGPLGPGIDATTLAIMFHRHYERLAPSHGYETRTETRKFDPDSPNGRLMIATCGAVLEELEIHPPAEDDLEDEEDAG